MISFFANHPTAANLLMILMIAAGVLSISGLRRETLPDASPVEVEVRVVFPGATSSEVEETVVQRLEDALDGVQHLKEMRGVAQQSLGTVTLRMLDNGDYQAFRNEIDNAVSSIDDFPDDTEPPIIDRLHTRQPVLDVLVSGQMNAVSMKAYCEQLRDRLIASQGISEVKIEGFSDHLLRVEISRESMQRYGLSPTDIASAISRQSLDLPAGKIEGEETVLVRVQESRKTRLALEDLVILGDRGGAEIRLRDIAHVSDEFELDEDKIIVDGNRGAVLKILKAKTEDTVQVAHHVKSLIEQERLAYPQVSLNIVNDESALVVDRISLLVKNGLQGLLLVFAMMWLFFSARLSFWVVISLPISFLAAFSLVSSLGLTINMITMVGLLMALGLLMDDGIVIAENIARRRAEGEAAMLAAVNGVKEVGGGVVSSFLTTCSVLGPLMFLSGELGRILKVLPTMLLLVLATSLIEAFFILPSHLGHSLAHEDSSHRNRIRKWLDRRIDAGRDLIGRLVGWTIRWRYLTAGLVVMCFLVTLGLIASGIVRGQVFPDLEGDTVVARVLMPPGTPLSRTEQVIGELERSLQRTNEVFKPDQPDKPDQPGEQEDLVLTTFVRFNQNSDAYETGAHVATIQADLLTNEMRNAPIGKVIRVWRDELGVVPDALSITMDEPVIGPVGRDIEVQISGLPLAVLDSVSEEMQDYLHTFKGVFNITDDLRLGEKEMLITLRPGAVGLGIDAQDLARQLRGSFQGLLSDQIQVGDEAYDIEVRFADKDRSSLSDLENYLVTLPGGNKVPIGEVAEISQRKGWSRIAHFNRQQVVSVVASVDTEFSNSMAVLSKMEQEKMPGLFERYPNLQVRIKGASEKGKETGASLLFAAAIGCLGVFVILSFQFRSYLEPLIVMMAIPFAFVGVVWGHFLFRESLSLPSIMGYASLAGIVVNDSILLVLFLKARRKSGSSAIEAASQASQVRFRAVMITSLTTIAGLMPLLLERSLQAQVLIPIAISICFGLMASTVLVLLVIPPMYVLLSDFGWTEQQVSEEAHE